MTTTSKILFFFRILFLGSIHVVRHRRPSLPMYSATTTMTASMTFFSSSLNHRTVCTQSKRFSIMDMLVYIVVTVSVSVLLFSLSDETSFIFIFIFRVFHLLSTFASFHFCICHMLLFAEKPLLHPISSGSTDSNLQRYWWWYEREKEGWETKERERDI